MDQTVKSAPKNLAPPGYGFAARGLYAAARFVYLAMTAAAFPLALHFVRSTRGIFLHIPQLVIWIVAFGAGVWIMIYIVLEQYNYPLGLAGAVVMTGSALSSFWSGAALTGYNVGYGAYHMLMGGLTAQLIFLGAAGAAYGFLKTIRHPRGRDLPAVVLALILFLTAAYAVLMLIMAGPLLNAFRQEKNAVYFAAAAAFFCGQVISDLRMLWVSSILNPDVMKDPLRNDLHEAWSLPAALALIASIVAAAIIALW